MWIPISMCIYNYNIINLYIYIKFTFINQKIPSHLTI